MTIASPTKRRLVLKMSVSLDGFVAGPNGEVDWIFRSSGGSDSSAWLLDTLRGAGVHIMGSRTYYDMAAFWPYSALPIADPMNEIPKLIFSRHGLEHGAQAGRASRAFAQARARNAGLQGVTPTEVVLRSWTGPGVARGDLVDAIRRLKDVPGPYILAHGGACFARSLVAAGLVDEYRLVIHPVALGQGQTLFSGLTSPCELRLISVTPFACGAVAAAYQPA